MVHKLKAQLQMDWKNLSYSGQSEVLNLLILAIRILKEIIYIYDYHNPAARASRLYCC